MSLHHCCRHQGLLFLPTVRTRNHAAASNCYGTKPMHFSCRGKTLYKPQDCLYQACHRMNECSLARQLCLSFCSPCIMVTVCVSMGFFLFCWCSIMSNYDRQIVLLKEELKEKHINTSLYLRTPTMMNMKTAIHQQTKGKYLHVDRNPCNSLLR